MAKSRFRKIVRKLPFYKRYRMRKVTEEITGLLKRNSEIDKKIRFLWTADAQIKAGGPIPPGVQDMAGRKAERHTPTTWRKLVRGEINALDKEVKKNSVKISNLKKEAADLQG